MDQYINVDHALIQILLVDVINAIEKVVVLSVLMDFLNFFINATNRFGE